MRFKSNLIFFCTLAVYFRYSHGCEMDNVSNWLLAQHLNILDVYRGELFSSGTTSISGINAVEINQDLNRGPYFDFVHENSEFLIRTNDAYADYEEYETETSISATVYFNCVGGTMRSMVFVIGITDTNNNDPQFRPTNELDFTVVPPLPPGFEITGCWNDIITRDIDLTTQRVDFEIFDSPYFEIAYDAESSTVAKEFKATLRTTTFIRSISEPLVFTISATDVDLTNDAPRTTYATVRIISDGEFELPEEPVFSETFYTATYTDENQVVLDDNISLRQGFHVEVEFTLEGEHSEYFRLVPSENGQEITIGVTNPLPVELFALRQIFLVVNAERNHTSGASATVILQLPEEETLNFQQPSYEGSIVDNILQLSQIVLTQGYDAEPVSLEIISEHASFFSYTIQQNLITLTMTPLPPAVIEQNNFLNLQVVASTSRSSASTIVILDIVKDDGVTPVFQRTLYEGTYDPNDGLTIDQIVLVQGYDNTVQVTLEGEHAAFFELLDDGPTYTLNTTGLTPDLFREQNVLLTVVATKPRTVGANAAIAISLPAETQLEFEQQNYKGVIEDNILELSPLILSQGYESGPVSVQIQNGAAHVAYFTPDIEDNRITIVMSQLPDDIIQSNTLLNLQVVASTEWSSASTVVTLEIIKDDNVTPVFERTLYEGSYNPVDGLTLAEIVLVQGYDATVQFYLNGDHATFFQIDRDGGHINLTAASIPESLFNERNILLSVEATKPRTVGAHTAISIDLPTDRELRFATETQSGTIRDNILTIGIIDLNVGYAEDVNFTLTGDYASYFIAPNVQSQVSLELREQLPETAILENNFLLLSLTASATNAVSTSITIVLEIVKEDTITPRFNQDIFFATYTDNSLEIERIYLRQGFDSSVTFRVDGEFSQYFRSTNTDNEVFITLASSIPEQVIFEEKVLTFSVLAEKELTVGAVATVSVRFPTELTHPTALRFSKNIYVGSLEDNTLSLENIILEHGLTETTDYTLTGDFSSSFTYTRTANGVIISTVDNVPPEVLANKFITLELQAEGLRAVPVTTAIIIDVIQSDEDVPVAPVFNQAYYRGVYTTETGLHLEEEIYLTDGFDETVRFELEGEFSQWFNVTQNNNSATISNVNSIPDSILEVNNNLLFTILATKPEANGRAVVFVDLPKEITSDVILGFDRINYVGSIEDNSVNLDPITLIEGYSSAVSFSLHGDLANYFTPGIDGSTVRIILNQAIPETSIPANRIITLEIQASAPSTLSAFATIVLEVVQDDVNPPITPVFSEAFYVGSYSTTGSFVFDSVISIADGYDATIEFVLEGEHAQWFRVEGSGNSVTIGLASSIPPAIVASNNQLVFAITAHRAGSVVARSAIVISLSDEITSDVILGFDRINYVGSIEDNSVNLDPITLIEGYSSAVSFSLHGDLANYFTPDIDGSTVRITLNQAIPETSIPANRIITLEIQASAPSTLSAFATIVLEIVLDESPLPLSELAFDQTYYIGTYTSNNVLLFNTPATLAEGYDGTVRFALSGDYQEHFYLLPSSNTVSLGLVRPLLPNVIADNQKLVFVLTAERPGSQTARATIIIVLEQDISSVIFDKVLYEGIIQSGVVQHETITITGFEGSNINLAGVYASLFSATLTDGTAIVRALDTLTLPADVSNVVLELRVANSGAVLVLEVSSTDGPELPTVTFDSGSYALRVEIGQVGLVGRVQASADNNEDVVYSLIVNNDHLRARISINSAGEILLTAPANSGVYNFEAVATTVFTQVPGSATIHLSVEALTVCGDETVTAPLIVIDRDEEQPLRDLVLLDSSEHVGCRYTLANRWPANQNWLYVDETGLHATAIDREHPSIAFMALSQIQIELTLVCDSDVTRTKRSTDERLDWLGPYDYGTNTWLLGETIRYNSRRSIVNLIVNDINDNYPIFIGKENEPIIVGYPIPELEETVLPRSLAELQATDADVGINAALVYWSSEPELAVSPATGFVHVTSNQRLEQDQILTVSATDLNGEGLTGSITLMVKLLDSTNIAVVTVRDAFLEDEGQILGNISNAIGYEVRSLRSVVVSDAEEVLTRGSRTKRESATTGASLEVHVYGLIQREPVSVEKLADDINNAAVVAANIASIQSLQDHLDGRLICDAPGRDTGLLVSTIILGVLLFLLIVAIIAWFVLKRIQKKNYDQFSDANSLASQNESPPQPPKPLDGVAVAKPRLNIEELKRSERRLQDMLNAPVDEVNPEPSTSETNAVTKIPLPDPMAPIVIQDKLKDAIEESDDDEFGERKKARRKSVVTFNENVEKIIHVDEEPDVIADPNYEVYKL